MREMPAEIPPGMRDMRRYADASLYYFATEILGYDKLVQRIHEPICLRLMDESNSDKTQAAS